MDQIQQLKALRDAARARIEEAKRALEESADGKMVASLDALIEELEQSSLPSVNDIMTAASSPVPEEIPNHDPAPIYPASERHAEPEPDYGEEVVETAGPGVPAAEEAPVMDWDEPGEEPAPVESEDFVDDEPAVTPSPETTIAEMAAAGIQEISGLIPGISVKIFDGQGNRLEEGDSGFEVMNEMVSEVEQAIHESAEATAAEFRSEEQLEEPAPEPAEDTHIEESVLPGEVEDEPIGDVAAYEARLDRERAMASGTAIPEAEVHEEAGEVEAAVEEPAPEEITETEEGGFDAAAAEGPNLSIVREEDEEVSGEPAA